MLASLSMNYVFGLLIDHSIRAGNSGKYALAIGILANTGLLIFFKYANFIVENFNAILARFNISGVELDEIHLPIGISFFTFQAMSYIIDIYRGESKVQKNPINLGLYISLFPQLIAGPIVRYHDIARQISKRTTAISDFASGAERFIFGLAKKVLIANPMGEMADQIFGLPVDQLSPLTAWLGITCYTLQIYFDFSGYSDMAIGLGRLFGFRFLENFNYPYISRSIREFWRRWHISLSTWFRDYLYFPLGGSRHGKLRTGRNLLIVFLLCGFWHGASWNFMIWGLLHGSLLVLERGTPGRLLTAAPVYLQHAYVIFMVMNAWVFFRIEELPEAINYLTVLYGGAQTQSVHPIILLHLDTAFLLSMIAGILLAFPVYPVLSRKLDILTNKGTSMSVRKGLVYSTKFIIVSGILIYSFSFIAIGSYNPFIYFRF